MKTLQIAQAVAGVGGMRVTFRVPPDAPEPCAVELCFVSADDKDARSAIDRLADLRAVPVGAAESIDKPEAVSTAGTRIVGCKPGGTYRVTAKLALAAQGVRFRILGRAVPA